MAIEGLNPGDQRLDTALGLDYGVYTVATCVRLNDRRSRLPRHHSERILPIGISVFRYDGGFWPSITTLNHGLKFTILAFR